MGRFSSFIPSTQMVSRILLLFVASRSCRELIPLLLPTAFSYPFRLPHSSTEIVTLPPTAKVRLASMALSINHLDEAHGLLKEALTSNPANLELRAFYLYFLVQCSPNNASSFRTALDFAWTTIRDARNDVYSLCAAGWLTYHAAREAKPTSAQMASESQLKTFHQEQSKNYLRSANSFDQALALDPECSFAAQGFAIAIAEDVLTMPGASGGVDEARTRVTNARQALAVFQRVRESVTEGSVYVNMGHCYFATDEFERAIESVGSLPFFVRLCLERRTRR